MRAAATSLARSTTDRWIPAVAWAAAVLALLVALPAGGADSKLISMVSPQDGDEVYGSIRWEVEVKDDAPGKIDFVIDGTVKWTENRAPYVFNGDSGMLDTTTLSDGDHTLEARLEPRDNGRSRGSDGKDEDPSETLIIHVEVDNSPLRVSTLSPGNAQKLSASVKWEAAVDGGPAPEQVDFAIDGVVKWTEREAPYVFNGDSGVLDTTKLNDGRHTLTVTASDPRRSAKSAIDVMVENAAAPASFTTNVSQGMTVATPFSWKFTPGDASVKGYFWADGKLLATVDGPGPYTWTLPQGLLSDGTHALGHSWDTLSGQRKMPSSTYSVTVRNGSSSGSVFTTNVSQGMTVATPFSWKFTPGDASVKGYFWADGKLLATVDGPGPYTWTLPQGLLSDGTHALGHSWDTLSGQRKMPSSTYSVTVRNGSSSGSVFTTNVSQGMTVATPFSWKFTPGDASVKGYFWADGKLLATVDGPGPYTWTLPQGLLSDGTHALGHSWDTLSGQSKMPSSTYSVTVRNGSSSGSVFTTNVSQGMTITTPFAWRFDPGETSVKGYFSADGKVVASVEGPGPYSWTLPEGLLANGTHTLGRSWLDTEGQRKGESSTVTVTIHNPSSGSGTSPLGESLPDLPPAPPATSARTIQVDTVSELKSAFSDLRGGDRVVVEPGTYPTQHTIKGKQLSTPAHVVFKPGASMTGGPRSAGNYVGFYVSNSDNIWFTGGNFSNPEGDAIKIDSSTNIVFNGAVAHHSGDSCIMVAATSRDNRAIWLLNVETHSCGNDRGDLASSGTYPVGYWRKGTHGIYYGSSWNGYKTYGGAIVNLYGHDQPNGSILQIGNGARGLVVTGATLVRAMGDPGVYAGNALNFWGGYNENVTWVNVLVYRVNNHIMQTPSGTQGAGSVLRALMYSGVGSSTLFERNTSGSPTIGQIWNADPQLGAADVPSAASPAVGKAEPAYLWPTDRAGRARTSRTLGAFEPSG